MFVKMRCKCIEIIDLKIKILRPGYLLSEFLTAPDEFPGGGGTEPLLFPGLFEPFFNEGLVGKAVEKGLLRVHLENYRRHGLGRHKAVDDEPYGGGAGMVLRPEPLFAAVRERKTALAELIRSGDKSSFTDYETLVGPVQEPG